MVSNGEGGIGWVGISRCKLLHIRWINKFLLYTAQGTVLTTVEKNIFFKDVYITESLCYTVEYNTTLVFRSLSSDENCLEKPGRVLIPPEVQRKNASPTVEGLLLPKAPSF